MLNLLITLLIFLFSATVSLADTVTVITKQNAIRENCKFFAPVKAQVKYNDKLEAFSTEGDWYRVRFGSVTGCIHKTAVETRTASAPNLFTGRGSRVSESEAALAGKGFNPQVEASYRKQHPEMKFYLVDNIERYPVSDRDVAQFIASGGLKQPL